MKKLAIASILVLSMGCSKDAPDEPTPTAPAPIASAKGGALANAEPARWGAANSIEAKTMVVVEPLDMMTSTAETVPTVSVFAPRNSNALGSVATRAHLVTWPEETEVDVEKVQAAAEDERSPSTVYLKPKAKLSDRWYAVKLDALPDTIVLPKYAQAKKLPGGAVISRFRPGSQPLVSWVEICEKDGKQTGGVVFSERVDPGSDASALLAFEDKSDCRFLPRPVTGVLDKSADFTTNTLRFTCDTPGDLRVSLKAGVKAVSTSLAVPETAVTLKRSAMEPMSDNCRRFVPAG